MSRLKRLMVKDTMRVQTIDLDVNGRPLVVVGGDNGNGKSSLITGARMALFGGKFIPDKPVRKGAKRAVQVAEFDDMTVEHSITAGGSVKLVVKGKDGNPLPGGPRALLAKAFGAQPVDALAFSEMDHKKQMETLRGLVGLDLSEIDANTEEAFEKRTETNREIKALKNRLDATTYHDDAPEEEVSIADLTRQLSEARRTADTNREAREDLESLQSRRDDGATILKNIEAEIHCLQQKMRQHEDALGNLDNAIKAQENEVASLVDPDLDAIEAKLAEADECNEKVRDNRAHAKVSEDLKSATNESEELTRLIDTLRERREQMIAEAEMPIDGLGFSDEGYVTFGGFPLSQTCDSDKLLIGVAVALKMAGDHKVLLVENGEKLDNGRLPILAQMAEEAGATILMERRSTGSECTIVIEDGALAQPAVQPDIGSGNKPPVS
jgi:hypothetical protein